MIKFDMKSISYMEPSNKIYKTLIIDDNEIDRLSVQLILKNYPFLNIVGVYESADEALPFINNDIDVLLLDIDMDGINGLDFRRKIGNEQTCIFITAYPDYAIESFELAALDFIVKPLQKDRFDTAMERLQQYLTIKHKADLFDYSLGGDSFFIKDGNDQIKIKLHEVLYLEALKDYTRIVTTTKKYCVLGMLGNLLEKLAFQSFIRIHRSYAVQKNFVEKITSSQIIVNNITLPIGRSFRESLNQLIHK